MNYGFEDGKFYLDIKACERPHLNMREEHELRAKEIAEKYKKICVSFSGGVDSQAMIHSFKNLGADFQSAFLYLPGYNDCEYEQVKVIEHKYGGINLNIIDFDVDAIQEELEQGGIEHDMPTLINILQRKFLGCLPSDWDFVQMAHDPFVYINKNNGRPYWYQGYYLPEISRQRIFQSLNRTGNNIFWCDTSEFLSSILDDDVFKAAIVTARYFDGNKARVPGKYLHTVDRWDFYIKPIVYGKYWKDELIYFPKFAGTENIAYISGNTEFRKHALSVPYYEFLNFLNQNNGETKRFYENVPYVKLEE